MTKFKNVDEYIRAQSPEIAKRLSLLRELFHSGNPDTVESIRYDMPAFTMGDGYLYISANKNHIGMYPTPDVPELVDKLEPYIAKDVKSSFHFMHSEPLPLELIKKIIATKVNTDS